MMTEARAIRIDAPGGPDAMRLATVELPAPAAGSEPSVWGR